MARGSRVVRSGFKGDSTAGNATATKSHGRGAKKPLLTHFLCLPLTTEVTRPQLESSLRRFRDIVRDQDEDIPLTAIRPIGTIHLTLGVMSLVDVDRVSEAIGHLQTLETKLMVEDVVLEENKPVERTTKGQGVISLTSLYAMQSPTKTSILYAGPDDLSKRLLPLCLQIRDAFVSAGFMGQDDRPLKLHATILNTLYAKRSSQNRVPSSSVEKVDGEPLAVSDSSEAQPTGLVRASSPPGTIRTQDTLKGFSRKSRAQIRINAAQLLEECKDFVWASEFSIEKIAICKMGAKKILDSDGNVIDEQYEEVASIAMPV